jgi:hypothetical protein
MKIRHTVSRCHSVRNVFFIRKKNPKTSTILWDLSVRSKYLYTFLFSLQYNILEMRNERLYGNTGSNIRNKCQALNPSASVLKGIRERQVENMTRCMWNFPLLLTVDVL